MSGERLISVNAVLAEAEQRIAEGRFGVALRLLLDVPLGTPGLDALLGRSHLGLKAVAPALAHLSSAVEADPSCHASRLWLGLALRLAANAQQSVRVLDDLRACAPNYPGVEEALAMAYRADARHDQVVALVDGVPNPTVQMRYDRAMALASLGDVTRCLAEWDAIVADSTDFAAAWYASHAAALDALGWDAAEQRLITAAKLPKANRKYQALLMAYWVLRDQMPADEMCPASHRYLVEGALAVRPRMAPGHRMFGLKPTLLRWALTRAERPGLVAEFGVRRGTSLRVIADAAGQEVHGFDSFEGLPQGWNNAPAGVLGCDLELPQVPDTVQLHAGWFAQTLPEFVAEGVPPVRFLNLDSDIYSSTREVLWALAPGIGPGTILVFDEFIGNRSWADDEYKAFIEFAQAFGVAWQIIALGLYSKQAVIEIL